MIVGVREADHQVDTLAGENRLGKPCLGSRHLCTLRQAAGGRPKQFGLTAKSSLEAEHKPEAVRILAQNADLLDHENKSEAYSVDNENLSSACPLLASFGEVASL